MSLIHMDDRKMRELEKGQEVRLAFSLRGREYGMDEEISIQKVRYEGIEGDAFIFVGHGGERMAMPMDGLMKQYVVSFPADFSIDDPEPADLNAGNDLDFERKKQEIIQRLEREQDEKRRCFINEAFGDFEKKEQEPEAGGEEAALFGIRPDDEKVVYMPQDLKEAMGMPKDASDATRPENMEPIYDVPKADIISNHGKLELMSDDEADLLYRTCRKMLRRANKKDVLHAFGNMDRTERAVFAAKLFSDGPVKFIKYMNSSVRGMDDLGKAIELEIILDSAVFDHSGRVYKGIPRYIPDGYVDMGKTPELRDRDGRREKIGLKKGNHKDLIIRAKKAFLRSHVKGTDLKMDLARYAREGLTYSKSAVRDLVERDGIDKTIGMKDFRDVGKAVCRHTDIMFQMLAQTAGAESYICKSPDHAYNFFVDDGKLFVVDATPSRGDGDPQILGFNRNLDAGEGLKGNFMKYIRELMISAGDKCGNVSLSYLPRNLNTVPNYFKVNGR